jgi:anti-sigma factor ChrR (cupin superfamily)
MTNDADAVAFDDQVALALAALTLRDDVAPPPHVKHQLLAQIQMPPAVPRGFSFRFVQDDDWLPHPVPGIRMKVLAVNRSEGYASLLLDVAPGTTFPAHHHGGPEDCYVISGSLFTCGRRLVAGDFVHADGDTDHGELFTEEGCRVLLVVPPEEHLPEYPERHPR